MSQMLAYDSNGQAKLVRCDDDGNIMTVPASPAPFAALIANGESLSGVVDLGGRTLGIVYMPAAWTAAGLSFQASLDGDTFFVLRDATGTEITLTVAADYAVHLDPALYAGIRYLKLRSGTSGAPVNQGAARTINLVAIAA